MGLTANELNLYVFVEFFFVFGAVENVIAGIEDITGEALFELFCRQLLNNLLVEFVNKISHVHEFTVGVTKRNKEVLGFHKVADNLVNSRIQVGEVANRAG